MAETNECEVPNGLGDKILKDEFTIYPKKVLHTVILYRKAISIQRVKNGENAFSPTVFDLDDIIGCHCMRGRQHGDKSAYFGIYAYPMGRKVFGGSKVRQRKVTVFRITSFDTFEANMVVAEKWRSGILMLLRGIDVNNEEDIQLKQIPPAKKILVLINPFSGQGKAGRLFRERVLPLLGESELDYKHIHTEYQGHARKVARNLKVSDWDGIAIVSGDGLVYEVINGLMSREDRDEAIKIPIGIIPGGSGNALATAILYSRGEPLTNLVLHSTYSLLKGSCQPLDLVKIQNSQSIMYSFLSTCWGIISDIDIESEKYRKLGDTRFTIQAAARIAKLRVYRGKLYFLRAENYNPEKTNEVNIGDVPHMSRTRSVANQEDLQHMLEDRECNGEGGYGDRPRMMRTTSEIVYPNIDRSVSYSEHFIDVNAPRSNERSQQTDPTSDESDDQTDNKVINSTNHISGGQSGENGDHVNSIVQNSEGEPLANQESGMTSQQSEQANQVNGGEPTTNHNSVEEIPANQKGRKERQSVLPPLDQPIPSNWVMEEGEFVNISAVYLSHLSTDVCCWPHRAFDEGVIMVQYLKAPVPRKILLKLFLELEKGDHLKSPHLKVEYVKAFRIEPDTDGEIMTVDGEKVDYGPIQGEVLPSIARIIL